MTKDKEKVKNLIQSNINKLEDKTIQLMDTSEHIAGGDVDTILAFNSEYTSIVRELEKVIEDIGKYDKLGTSDFWEKTASLYDDLNYIYDEAAVQINNVFASKTQELEEETRQRQGIQLAIFSIVLSILAFVLTNAKILAVENISFKNVLLVNLSFILSSDVLFSLIYLFMGPAFYSKKGGLRIFTFIILPILLIVAITLVSIFVK